MLDADHLEQLVGDLTHQFMLRLVLEPRLAAPGGDEEARDAEGVIERGQRVDGVAETRILKHDDALPPSEPGARCDRHRLALARRADIVEIPGADDAIDERRQEATGHAAIEIE